MTDYKPVPCAQHSRYELYVMTGKALRVSWRDANGHRRERELVPSDVLTRDGEEFLVLEGRKGERLELRLDRIIDAHPADGV